MSDAHNGRPRTFVWMYRNGVMYPQIWFDDPRVGCADHTPVADRQLKPDEFVLSLDDLARKYPAPPIGEFI